MDFIPPSGAVLAVDVLPSDVTHVFDLLQPPPSPIVKPGIVT
jgi:hypothetical protein